MRTLPYRLGHRSKASIEKSKRELTTGSGEGAAKLLNKLSDFEANRLKKGKRFPFGGSVIIAVKKRQVEE